MTDRVNAKRGIKDRKGPSDAGKEETTHSTHESMGEESNEKGKGEARDHDQQVVA